MNAKSACPCGAPATRAECCGPYLEGAEPPTPEALMRSRFTAFVERDAAHLARTLHPDADGYEEGEASYAAVFKRDGRSVVYRQLTVLDAPAATDDVGAEGFVLFAADIRRKGKRHGFVEDSTFIRTDAGWRYLCGTLKHLVVLQREGVDVAALDRASFGALT